MALLLFVRLAFGSNKGGVTGGGEAALTHTLPTEELSMTHWVESSPCRSSV